MGKVSPKERESKNSKHKKRLRGSSNKYLKPGTLAQLRYSKASAARSCTDLGRKRVAVLDTKKSESNLALEDSVIDRSPLMLSPGNLVRESSLLGTPKVIDKSPLMLSPVNLIKQGSFFGTPKVIDKSPLMLSPANLVRQNSFLGTPKTPRVEDCMSESRLESLPMDLLVFLICLTFLFLCVFPLKIFWLCFLVITHLFIWNHVILNMFPILFGTWILC